MERIEELIARKRAIFSWYQENLDEVEGVTINCEAPHIRNLYWMVTMVQDQKFGLKREEVMERLDRHGIDSRPFFHPLSSVPAYAESVEAKRAQRLNLNSYRISPYALNLPSALSLTEDKVRRVCEALQRIIAGK